MLWDTIRDFFVQHVFGGMTSNGVTIPSVLGYGGLEFDDGATTTDVVVLELKSIYGDNIQLSMADWLSTTATIISISIIVVLCCLFVYKIIKLIGGLIR